MGRRGGRRPRRLPAGVPVSSSGRWGRRRAHVGQCTAILAAELVYGKLICDGKTFAPGWCATLEWKPEGPSGPCWTIRAEVVPNAVWRRGRLFFRCAHCQQRATRLYVPVVGLQPRCRRCWGLSYESQSWSYKACGFLRSLGPVATGRRVDIALAGCSTSAAALPGGISFPSIDRDFVDHRAAITEGAFAPLGATALTFQKNSGDLGTGNIPI